MMIDIEKNIRDLEYKVFFSKIDNLLTSMVAYDLGGSGMYLDDEIGEMAFNMDVIEVVEQMAMVLWDSYNDNIEDVVIENLGSDFKHTI